MLPAYLKFKTQIKSSEIIRVASDFFKKNQGLPKTMAEISRVFQERFYNNKNFTC